MSAAIQIATDELRAALKAMDGPAPRDEDNRRIGKLCYAADRLCRLLALDEEVKALPPDHPWAPKLALVPELTVDSLHRELITELAKLGPSRDVDAWDLPEGA